MIGSRQPDYPDPCHCHKAVLRCWTQAAPEQDPEHSLYVWHGDCRRWYRHCWEVQILIPWKPYCLSLPLVRFWGSITTGDAQYLQLHNQHGSLQPMHSNCSLSNVCFYCAYLFFFYLSALSTSMLTFLSSGVGITVVGWVFFCLPFTLNTTWPKQSLSFQVYVLKRPHVDEFLQRMGELFECVLFTASLAKVCSSLHPINPYDAGLWVGFSMDNYFCSLALS